MKKLDKEGVSMEKVSSRGIFYCLVLLLVFLLVFSSTILAADKVKIAITQIVEHPALDEAKQGFIDVLAENGYVEGENLSYDIQNAQGEIVNTNTIAQKFALDRPDLVLAISTPSAAAVANAIKDIPILITAVTDPVYEGLVESAERPNTNITGTNDMNPIKEQFELILQLLPGTKNVGVIYNPGESNSVVQVELAEDVAKDLGLELVEASVSTSTDVLLAANSLVGRVDAIYIPTDNTVVSTIESVVMIAEDNNIPIIAGEENSVVRGALGTIGINYYRLGRQTGEMALRILKGELKPEDMPIESQKDYRLVINIDAAEAMGVEIPEDILNSADEIYTNN